MAHKTTNQALEIGDKRKHPFFIIDNDLIKVYGPKIGAYGIAIYNVLAFYANRHDEAWPSYQTIANQLKMSRPKVFETIQLLVSLGLVEKEQRTNESGGLNSNSYTLVDLHPRDSKPETPPSKPDVLPSTPDILPSNPDVLGVVSEAYQGSKPELLGVVSDVNYPSKPHVHEQDPINKTQLEQDPGNKREGIGARDPAPSARKPSASPPPSDSRRRKIAEFYDENKLQEGHILKGQGSNPIEVYLEIYSIEELRAKKITISTIVRDELKRQVIDLVRWREVVLAWRMNDYKAGNWQGMLDWYRDGIPKHSPGPQGAPTPKGAQGSMDSIDRVEKMLIEQGIIHE